MHDRVSHFPSITSNLTLSLHQALKGAYGLFTTKCLYMFGLQIMSKQYLSSSEICEVRMYILFGIIQLGLCILCLYMHVNFGRYN